MSQMLALRVSLRASRPKWKSLMLNTGYPFSRTAASIMQLHYLLIGALFLLCLSFSIFFFNCTAFGIASHRKQVSMGNGPNCFTFCTCSAVYQYQCLSVDMTNIVFGKDNVSSQWVYPEWTAKIEGVFILFFILDLFSLFAAFYLKDSHYLTLLPVWLNDSSTLAWNGFPLVGEGFV